MQQPSQHKTYDFIHIILQLINNPTSVVTVLTSLFGAQWWYSGERTVTGTISNLLLLFAMLAFLMLILYMFSRTYVIIIVLLLTTALTITTCGWCFKNNDECIAFYDMVNVRYKAFNNGMNLFVLSMYGSYTMPEK
jgi:prepilin signal peptidase PulO-like enzyme (type II secretory pathway)